MNVIITRARERCVVFSNFTWRDLKITESSGLGIRILKSFLQFAESGDISCSTISGGDSESPFEDAVYEFLVSNNYEVHRQIGCAGFRIDMAVVDPRQPGRYLVGIECDGAQYHSSEVARDRDRLRQQILIGLGWKIHRVWSTDWYLNSVGTKQKLIESIEKLKKLPLNTVETIKSNTLREGEVSNILLETNTESQNSTVQSNRVNIPDYRIFNRYFSDFDLTTISQPDLDEIICSIVDIEGPIHTEELLQRIRVGSNNTRISPRIRERILLSCRRLATRKNIRQQGDFLWQSSPQNSILRRRMPDQGINIDWICDQEISEAIDYVLSRQYATSRDDLITTTLRIFGLQRRTDRAISKLDEIIEHKITSDKLYELPNGKIDLRR